MIKKLKLVIKCIYYLFPTYCEWTPSKMDLFYESTSRKDNQGEAAARWAGDAQPRCYSTRCHDPQTAPGVVARNAARHFLNVRYRKRQELQHLGTRLLPTGRCARSSSVWELLMSGLFGRGAQRPLGALGRPSVLRAFRRASFLGLDNCCKHRYDFYFGLQICCSLHSIW